MITWISPVNEFVTGMDSGQLSRTGEETSFFISEKNKNIIFLFKEKEKRLNIWPA